MLATEPEIVRADSNRNSAEWRRWSRSLHASLRFDKDGNCVGWRGHMNFAVEEIYGRLLSLAERDYRQEMFAWPGWSDLAKKSKFDGKQYSRRLVFAVLKTLSSNGLIEPDRRVRWEKRRKGWVVKKHDDWAVNFEPELGTCELKSRANEALEFIEECRKRREKRSTVHSSKAHCALSK